MENKTIKIGINASFSRKPQTGIGQVTNNILRRLDILEGELSKITHKKVTFVIYLEEDLTKKNKLPINIVEKKVFLPFWKRDDLIRKVLWEKFLLPRYIKKDRCDFFLSLYQSATIIRSKKIQHLMLVHDLIPKIFPSYLDNFRKHIYQKFIEKSIKKSDKIIAISKRTEKDLIQKLQINGEKISTSYIDVDDSYKREISKNEREKVLKKYNLKSGYIFAGGGYEIRKNVEKVIYAYKFLQERNKKEFFLTSLPQLVIYGKLMPKLFPLITDAEKLVRQLNLTKSVKLLGVVNQTDLPALFAQASCFVYPSYYEGFGLPALEAMNVGTPTIVSKKSSLPEVGGDSVLYCEPDSTDDIAMVIKNVLTNPKLRLTLSRRGKIRAKYFSWNNFLKKTAQLIYALNNKVIC